MTRPSRASRQVPGSRTCRAVALGAKVALFNFQPPASDDEIRDASLQFVRASARQLIAALSTSAAPKDRQVVAARAKARAAKRFA